MTKKYYLTVLSEFLLPDLARLGLEYLPQCEVLVQQWPYDAKYDKVPMPTNLAVSCHGEVYAIIGPDIKVFNAQGKELRTWEDKYLYKSIDYWNPPGGIGISPDGKEVYLARFRNDEIRVYSPGGKFLRSWPIRSYSPHELHVDREGKIYLSNGLENNVRVYDREGKLLRQWGEYGEGEGQFSNPAGIAVFRDKDLCLGNE
jgi:tripartite motif-containing protein 71